MKNTCICIVLMCNRLLPSCPTATIRVTPRSTLATSPQTQPPSPTWKTTTATPTTPASTTSASRPRPSRLSVAHPLPQRRLWGLTHLRPPTRSWTDSTPRSTSPDPRLPCRTSIQRRLTGERGEGRGWEKGSTIYVFQYYQGPTFCWFALDLTSQVL